MKYEDFIAKVEKEFNEVIDVAGALLSPEVAKLAWAKGYTLEYKPKVGRDYWTEVNTLPKISFLENDKMNFRVKR